VSLTQSRRLTVLLGAAQPRGAGSVRLVLALALITASAGCGASGLSLRVVGNRLLDGRSQPIRLLGVNRSGPEYACIAPASQHLGLFDGPTDKQAIAVMASWRINAVRIPLNEDCWLGINGVPERYGGARYRAAIRGYVIRLHAAGLYVVLDLHWNAPGATLARGQQAMADADHSPSFWRSVARTFRDDPAVAFDLYNEAHNIDWRCWLDGCELPQRWRTAGMQQLVNAVRSTGANQPIIATGLGWGSDLSSWLEYRPNDPAKQLVAGLHVYDFRSCSTPACWFETVSPVSRAVPVVATELGQRGCKNRFMESFMNWSDAAGVSYIGWTWHPDGCAAPSLIQSWTGQPTNSGNQLRAHLLKLR
jgi:endoglucanase